MYHLTVNALMATLTKPNLHIRADVGESMGMTKLKSEASIQYSYWSNKFGVQTDKNESAVSAIVRFDL
jgi:hypothetical protein